MDSPLGAPEGRAAPGLPDLDALAGLLNRVFSADPPYSVRSLRWHYLENPVGLAAVGQALDGDRPVGNYALIPQRLVDASGRDVLVGLGVDLAVDPGARRSGAFRATVDAAAHQGRGAGLDAILGVANASSAPRMVGALGWRALDPLPVTLCPPTPRRPALESRPVTPDLLASPWFSSACGPGFAPPHSVPGRFAPHWTGERLAWRVARPGHRYALHLGPHHLAVSSVTRVRGLRCGVILKVLPRNPPGPPIASTTVAAAVGRLHRTPVVVHWGANPHLRVQGIRLPANRMPSPLALVLHPLHGDMDADGFGLESFELLDFDAF